MKYFLGGYYLVQLRPKQFGTDPGQFVYTCSDCFNDHLVDVWSYSWTIKKDKQTLEAKEKWKLSDDHLSAIRTWVDNKHMENKLGWINVFTDLETALEYRNTFFAHVDAVKIMALYFDEAERKDILEDFKRESDEMGETGLRLTLLKGLEENEHEVFLGFDYIGIERYGDIHTFHCHDIGNELSDRFDLTLNTYGLFDNDRNAQQVLDYLNDEKTGCEPVPWFIAKVKLLD